MQSNRYIPFIIAAVAIFSGCMTIPKNASVADAHDRYNTARTDPQVASLAAVELQDAADTLAKADAALSKRERTSKVEHLAYIAKQQVRIAEETAKLKAADLEIAEASTNRDQIRLQARTAEVDAARQETAVAQGTADQQAIALAAAKAKAARDQDIIAQQELQLKDLNVKKTDRGLVITIGDVLFGTNKVQLEPSGVRSLQKLADFLKQYPEQRVTIEGFTDSVGSSSLNKDLSDRRAEAVRTALLGMGISNDRVAIHGYGEAFPVADNDSATSRQMNRRVEIILTDSVAE